MGRKEKGKEGDRKSVCVRERKRERERVRERKRERERGKKLCFQSEEEKKIKDKGLRRKDSMLQ